jgi:methylenetetrahydrofolate dehydrogenase (NADP+) / methenyltetrahydrofolate cyclohydrolase
MEKSGAISSKSGLVDGKLIAETVKRSVLEEVMRLKQDYGSTPGLAVVRVGDDPASAVYVGSKVRTSEELGLMSEQHVLPAETSTEDLLSLIRELNRREEIDGILVQLPLPAHIDERRVIESIDPDKDVDGFHPVNAGRLALGQPGLVPCTPLGIIEMLESAGVPIQGAHICIVGRSNIVGKPVAQLLLQKNATVTICHSRTRDLPSVTRQADILVAAVGVPGFIRKEHIRPGAVVVDVGINRVSDPVLVRDMFGADLESRLAAIEKRGFTIVGDVNPREADEIAMLRTPVPGGVGLLTVAMLMKNTVDAFKRRRGLT